MKKIDDLFFPPRMYYYKRGCKCWVPKCQKLPGLKSNALWHQLQIDTEIRTSTYQMESNIFLKSHLIFLYYPAIKKLPSINFHPDFIQILFRFY